MADITVLPIEVGKLSFYTGDTFAFPDYTIKPGGVVTDFSSYTWKAQWRPAGDSETFVELTVDTSEANVGKFGITASAAQTATMKGSGVWDLQATLGAIVKTWIRGTTMGYEDVTRG